MQIFNSMQYLIINLLIVILFLLLLTAKISKTRGKIKFRTIGGLIIMLYLLYLSINLIIERSDKKYEVEQTLITIDQLDVKLNENILVKYSNIYPDLELRGRNLRQQYYVTIKDVNENITNRLSKSFKNIIYFNSPEKMIKGFSTKVYINLSKQMDLIESLKSLDKTNKIRYARKIQVNLLSDSKESFEIVPIERSEQIVTNDTITKWSWSVTPLKRGEHKLFLSINAYIYVDNFESVMSIKTLDKKIIVDINYFKEFIRLLIENIKWLLASMIFPIIAFYWIKKHEASDKNKV